MGCGPGVREEAINEPGLENIGTEDGRVEKILARVLADEKIGLVFKGRKSVVAGEDSFALEATPEATGNEKTGRARGLEVETELIEEQMPGTLVELKWFEELCDV